MSYKERRIIEFLPWAQRFARSCALRLRGYLDRDDLQSAGVLGFLRAAARYDGTKGASFRGFCAVRIRGAVLDELRRWDWAPRSVHKNYRRITRVTSVLIEQLEREPTPAELAAALEMEMAELSVFQSMAQPRHVVSFDEAGDNSRGGDGLPLSERLADPAMDRPDAPILNAEERVELRQCLKKLPKTQATVITLHYSGRSAAGHRGEAGGDALARLAAPSSGARPVTHLVAAPPGRGVIDDIALERGVASS